MRKFDLTDLKGTGKRYEGIEMSTNGLIKYESALIKPFEFELERWDNIGKMTLILYLDSMSFEVRNSGRYRLDMDSLVPFLLKDKDFRLMVKIYQSIENREMFSIDWEDPWWEDQDLRRYYIHTVEEDTKLSKKEKFLFEVIKTPRSEEVYEIPKIYIGDFVETCVFGCWKYPYTKIWYTKPNFIKDCKTKPSKII